MLRVGTATAVGARPVNEDALCADRGVYVVADGMGGHDAGEVAARVAVEVVRGAQDSTPTAAQAAELLRRAHAAVRAVPSAALRRPGTTLTGLLLGERGGEPCWLVVNVGDSRTYRWADGTLTRLTRDHSEVAELVERGLLPPEAAHRHPRRHVVTRVLGGGAADVEPDVTMLPVRSGDRLLVCSDGLTDELTDPQIAAVLAAQPEPQPAADALVAGALDAGGSDNVTVVVVDVG